MCLFLSIQEKTFLMEARYSLLVLTPIKMEDKINIKKAKLFPPATVSIHL